MIHVFRYDGDTPSKKDQQQIFRGKSGRPFITSSQRHKVWHAGAMLIMKVQRSGIVGVTWPIQRAKHLVLTIFYADFRIRDLLNTAESVMDLMKDAEILHDDNWKVTGAIGLFPVHRPGAPGWDLRITTADLAPGPAQEHRNAPPPEAPRP